MSVHPFPRCRHRPFVEKHAANVAYMGRAAGEKYLAQQIDVQRKTMLKRGIEPTLIEVEVKALESAIRSELWRIIMQTPETRA
ncbi:DUF6074 family protein [Enterovirga rhinocerotis]|uniref:Uncharacterized protein n=1 Tax=Enterovirga rhinocerotis TaxID=1339210 RepID=A0A4R7BUP8_9HYPH|nr:DUF6074 family protein [Enterovirga rhinocerotis]TDR89123.1 hypothetical protein EV668_3611 [Enterovirga rhinocerotis]